MNLDNFCSYSGRKFLYAIMTFFIGILMAYNGNAKGCWPDSAWACGPLEWAWHVPLGFILMLVSLFYLFVLIVCLGLKKLIKERC